MSCPFPLKNRHPRVIPGESLKTSVWHPLLARLLSSPCYHHGLYSIPSARQRVVQVRVSTRWFLPAIPSFSLFSSAPEWADPFCSVPASPWASLQPVVPRGSTCSDMVLLTACSPLRAHLLCCGSSTGHSQFYYHGASPVSLTWVFSLLFLTLSVLTYLSLTFSALS